MKTLIIDDELHARKYIRNLIREHFPWLPVVGEAGSVAEAKAKIKAEDPDLLLLDVKLDPETGFDLLTAMGPQKYQVIFITGYDEFALRAIRFAAIDYLIKPVQPPQLKEALDRARERFEYQVAKPMLEGVADLVKETRKSKLAISVLQRGEYLRVPIQQIMYCSAINHCVELTLENGDRLVATRSLNDLEDLLAPYDFIRCHYSYMLNKDYVRSSRYSDNRMSLVMKNGASIPVARSNVVWVKKLLHL